MMSPVGLGVSCTIVASGNIGRRRGRGGGDSADGWVGGRDSPLSSARRSRTVAWRARGHDSPLSSAHRSRTVTWRARDRPFVTARRRGGGESRPPGGQDRGRGAGRGAGPVVGRTTCRARPALVARRAARHTHARHLLRPGATRRRRAGRGGRSRLPAHLRLSVTNCRLARAGPTVRDRPASRRRGVVTGRRAGRTGGAAPVPSLVARHAVLVPRWSHDVPPATRTPDISCDRP